MTTSTAIAQITRQGFRLMPYLDRDRPRCERQLGQNRKNASERNVSKSPKKWSLVIVPPPFSPSGPAVLGRPPRIGVQRYLAATDSPRRCRGLHRVPRRSNENVVHSLPESAMLAVAEIAARGPTTIAQDLHVSLCVTAGEDGAAIVRRVQLLDIQYPRTRCRAYEFQPLRGLCAVFRPALRNVWSKMRLHLLAMTVAAG